MTNQCIFCKIISKEIKSEIINEDKDLIVFKDINPKAQIHFLIVPRKHIIDLNHATTSDSKILSGILFKAKEIAEKLGVKDSGYRLVLNTGPYAGMIVEHLHLHFLSDKK